LVRGALEAVAFEVGDLVKIVDEISPGEIREISVDGGLSQSKYLLQFQADLSGKTIRVFPEKEATSLGVFYLWANRLGLLSREFIKEKKQKALIFEPQEEEKKRNRLWKKWQKGIDKVRGWAKNE
jgi:glycerol kinase